MLIHDSHIVPGHDSTNAGQSINMEGTKSGKGYPDWWHQLQKADILGRRVTVTAHREKIL